MEPPGDGEGELLPVTVRPLGTITQSSESLDGDVSLLDLKVEKKKKNDFKDLVKNVIIKKL